MEQIPLQASYYPVFLPYLSLFQKPGTSEFELRWESPIEKAWLVMVDECVLRIDVIPAGKKHSMCGAIVNRLGGSPFLKIPFWDHKQVIENSNSATYSFPVNA